jgi:hypothetical protein
MATEWLKSVPKILERMVDKPPYFACFFAGVIILITSTIFRFGYIQAWIFLIYSVVGLIWRYATKDLKTPLIEKYPKAELLRRIIYHVGNLVLSICMLLLIIKTI